MRNRTLLIYGTVQRQSGNIFPRSHSPSHDQSHVDCEIRFTTNSAEDRKLQEETTVTAHMTFLNRTLASYYHIIVLYF